MSVNMCDANGNLTRVDGVPVNGLKYKPLQFYPRSYTWSSSSSTSGLIYKYDDIANFDSGFADVNKIVSAMIYDWSGLDPSDFNVAGDGGYGFLVSTKTSGWDIGHYLKIMIVYT